MASAGGLVTLSRHGAEHFSELARRSKSASIYADTPAARRLRMQDLRRKRGMTAAEWTKLCRSREASFGLVPGTLK